MNVCYAGVGNRQKKLDRRLARRTARGLDDDPFSVDEEKLEAQSKLLDHLKRDTGEKPAGTGLMLPEGTTRVMHKLYEEVSVPPVMPPDYDKDELVPVKEFSEFSQVPPLPPTHMIHLLNTFIVSRWHLKAPND
jgi:hypothetical protein